MGIRIKAKAKKGIVEVKAMTKHPMMSYLEATNASKKKGKKINANFITNITAKCNGEIVYEASTSQFLSKDPYFKFAFKGAKKGDKVEISWVDLSGKSETDSGKIK
jgi:sulfur-oxidizing protein SoxZ